MKAQSMTKRRVSITDSKVTGMEKQVGARGTSAVPIPENTVKLPAKYRIQPIDPACSLF
jgi:hypothetical protein